MSDEPNLPVEPGAPVEPEVAGTAPPGQPPMSRGQKARDFMIGFFGGLVLNVALGLLIYGVQLIQFDLPAWLLTTLICGESIAPWVLNLGLIIFLVVVLKRGWIAIGLLVLFVIPFVLLIISLLVIMVACLTGGGLGGL